MDFDDFIQTGIDICGKGLVNLGAKKGSKFLYKKFARPRIIEVILLISLVFVLNIGATFLCTFNSTFITQLVSTILFISAFILFLVFFIKWLIAIVRFVKFGRKEISFYKKFFSLIPKREPRYDISSCKLDAGSFVFNLIKIILPEILIVTAVLVIYYFIMIKFLQNRILLINPEIDKLNIFFYPFYHVKNFFEGLIYGTSN